MNSNENDSGKFWWGVVITAVIMYLFYHPTYQGKTAQELSSAYDDSQQTIQDWQNSYKAVGDCLNEKANQWDSINANYSYDNIYTGDFSEYTYQADNGWIYSGFEVNSSTSPTDEMNNCFTDNTTPQ